MCDDKVFDRFTSGMTAGKERFPCAKWRWWHIRVRQRQRRCSALHTYLVNLKCYVVQGWLWSLGWVLSKILEMARLMVNVENQFAVKYLSDILILTLVLYQGVKYYPDFFVATNIVCVYLG